MCFCFDDVQYTHLRKPPRSDSRVTRDGAGSEVRHSLSSPCLTLECFLSQSHSDIPRHGVWPARLSLGLRRGMRSGWWP